MIVSVAAFAPATPPDTGASISRRPALRTRSSIASTARAGRSPSGRPRHPAEEPRERRPRTAPPRPGRRSPPSGSGHPPRTPPRRPSRPVCLRRFRARRGPSAFRSYPVTANPLARRFVAMGSPMAPRPTKATRVMSFLLLRDDGQIVGLIRSKRQKEASRLFSSGTPPA